MVRMLFTYIVPLLGPLALYLTWNAYRRRYAAKHGGEAPGIEKGPVFWCIVAGFILFAISMVSLALMSGDKPGQGLYIAPRLQDGKILPPEYRPVEPPAKRKE